MKTRRNIRYFAFNFKIQWIKKWWRWNRKINILIFFYFNHVWIGGPSSIPKLELCNLLILWLTVNFQKPLRNLTQTYLSSNEGFLVGKLKTTCLLFRVDGSFLFGFNYIITKRLFPFNKTFRLFFKTESFVKKTPIYD